jgi:hypothetical protein
MQSLNLELNDKNFNIYAARHYNNPNCLDVDDFYGDVDRFKYLKKLFNKYNKKKILQERLILNHLIIIYNVFAVSAASQMCFYKLNEEHWPALKTFLLYLNYIHPDEYMNIPSDLYITKKLQQI